MLAFVIVGFDLTLMSYACTYACACVDRENQALTIDQNIQRLLDVNSYHRHSRNLAQCSSKGPMGETQPRVARKWTIKPWQKRIILPIS